MSVYVHPPLGRARCRSRGRTPGQGENGQGVEERRRVLKPAQFVVEVVIMASSGWVVRGLSRELMLIRGVLPQSPRSQILLCGGKPFLSAWQVFGMAGLLICASDLRLARHSGFYG